LNKVIGYLYPNQSQELPRSYALNAALRSPRTRLSCGPIVFYDSSKDFTRRLSFDGPAITIYGWPSLGGVIMFGNPSPADFDFLMLDRQAPQMLRYARREEEDEFCQKLLLLGAKWWDSFERCLLLKNDIIDIPDLYESSEPLPTIRERHWVNVAWPNIGGLMVSKFDTNMLGVQPDKEVVPEDVARLQLCTSMDEKAKLLTSRFEGTYLSSIKEYQGNGFIGCWVLKNTGKIGDFLQTWKEP
jgi:hypothetical protein